MTNPEIEPTDEQFSAFRLMFDHLNVALFAGELPRVMLNLSRAGARTVAFFAPRRWRRHDGQTTAHEISLNPAHLADGTACDAAQSLVHEMAHLWQHHYGMVKDDKTGRRAPRSGYHDCEWGRKMVAIGLQPLNAKTGKPALSGFAMSDRLIPGGPFERAFSELPPAALLPWSSVEADRRAPAGEGGAGDDGGEGEGAEPTPAPSRNKVKYTCPTCAANVWGKPGLVLACVSGHDLVLLQGVAS